MKTVITWMCGGLVLLACGWVVGIGSAEDARPKALPAKEAKSQPVGGDSLLGRRVPDFVLPDHTGKQVALSDFHEAKLVVVVFLGTSCPIGNAYVPELNELQKRYQDQQVQVIGINSNLSESAESIAKHVQEFQISFPVLVDHEQLAADLIGTRRMAQSFVLDGRRRIRYHGRIDDRVGYDFRREKARRSDLEEAIKELLVDKPVSVAATETEGCLITRSASLNKGGEITYAKHVAKIFHQRCAECHYRGTAAPFSLLSYDDARSRAEMIKEVVVQRRMPPWNADPRYGHFSNDLRMTKRKSTRWSPGSTAELRRETTAIFLLRRTSSPAGRSASRTSSSRCLANTPFRRAARSSTNTSSRRQTSSKTCGFKPRKRGRAIGPSYITSSRSFARRAPRRLACCRPSLDSHRARSRPSFLWASASKSPPARRSCGKSTTHRPAKWKRTARKSD